MADSSMTKKYFKDYFRWNLVLVALLSVAFTVGLCVDMWGKYWIIPAVFLLIKLMSIRYDILFITAVRDLKQNHIKTVSVTIREAVHDKKYQYQSRGVMIGEEKCLLIDAEGLQYRVSANKGILIASRLRDYYHGAQVTLRYLERSRIVTDIQMMNDHLSARRVYHDFGTQFKDSAVLKR
jgi:hypothetical protein